jgi:hypothetical protein
MTSKISMIDFLKMYTAIPHKFIDQHYKFYEMCQINVFGIITDDILGYLEIVNHKKFCERIRNNYKINVDYIISKTKINNKIKSNYYTTFDCFEKICSESKSKKGIETRDYFIIMRKFIHYYRDYFSKTINELAITGKYVYILMVNKGKNIFKVGRTENVRKRLFAYATGREKHPDIHFIMIVDDPVSVENCVKSLADKNRYKKNKELYQVDFDSLQRLVSNCGIIHKDFLESMANKQNYDNYIIYDESKLTCAKKSSNKNNSKIEIIKNNSKNKLNAYKNKRTSRTGTKKINKFKNNRLNKTGTKKTSTLKRKASYKKPTKLTKKIIRKIN